MCVFSTTVVWRVVLIFLVCLLGFHEDACSQEKRHILILHSYNKGLEWTDSEDTGIMTALQPRLDMLEVHTEYMDTKRFASDAELDNFLRFLVNKYGSIRFSCILCTDDSAFNFALHLGRLHFPEVPIVFCGVNYLDEQLAAENRGVFTGVIEAFDVRTTLKTALYLHPQTAQLVVINDRTITGRANRRILDAIMPEFEGKVAISFLEDLTMAELQETVRSLPDDALILLMTFNRDSSGRVFDYNESIALISRAAKVPIYGVWDFYLGKGIVGGMLTSGIDQGRIAAELALRIIDGVKVEDIPVITESPNRFMFDYRELQRFGVTEGELPFGSIVVNEPVSFMAIHGKVVNAALIIVGVLVMVIVLLLARIVERRRSVRALEKAHRLTVTTLESITDGFIAVDRDFRFTYVNREAERMLGHERETLLGHDYWEVFAFMADSELARFYRQVMERGIGGEFQYYHAEPGAEVGKWLAVKAYSAENGGISMYLRDVTEEKAINDERIRLATAIEQAAEAIFIADTGWIVQYVNPAFEQMTGYSRDEIAGRHIRLLQSDAHDRDFYRQVRQTLEAGEVWSGRMVSRRKDGSLIHTEATKSPVRDRSGNIINFVGVSRDITVEMRLERELRQAQKMEAIGTLAGGIAHDFNNILAIILGFTEIAMMKAEPGQVKENLQRVKEAANRATDLVRQILAFGRKSEHEKVPVDFVVFLKEALRLMRPLLPTTIEIVTQISDERPLMVSMDLTEMHQVVMNLCTNSAHAMGPKGGVLGVEVSDFFVDTGLASRHPDLRPGGYVRLSVSDTGVGIEPGLLERIFDPYFTTKEAGEGTGLGLSVVRALVKGHGGAINVYSEPDRGTTFRIFLPLIRGGDTSSSPAVETFPRGSERILFVDDEENLARLGAEMLEPSGYTVTVKADSTEALATFQADPGSFDLLITDMTMPRLTGKALAEACKAIRPDFPVILCTGFSELINERSARAAGVDDFLMKPYTVVDLLRKITAVLRKWGKSGVENGAS